MMELDKTNKVDGVSQITVTPSTYEVALAGLKYDSVHLIKLYPDITDSGIDYPLMNKYYVEERRIEKFVEGIKSHNI